MATTNYLVLLLLTLIAGTVLGIGMEQQEQKEDQGPDPRRPRPPSPSPPRPMPPQPPQPPQPPPAPPAGTRVVVTSAQAVGISQEYVPDVDPGNLGPGISGTGARKVASSSSSAPISVGVFGRNPEGELQCQHKRYLHVIDQDNVATKRMKIKDESQKATEAQDKNRCPSVKGSAVEHSGFDCEGLIGVLLASKRGRDGSEPTFNIESDDATASTIPETKDYQNADSSDDEVVAETASGDDGAAEDSETYDSSCIYVDARGKAYRRLKNLHVVGLLREGGEREEECQNTESPRAAPPDSLAQSPYSVIPPPLFADKALGEFRPLPPVHNLDLRSEHIHLEAVTDQPNCAAMSDPTQRTVTQGSATFKDPGVSVNQSRAYQRDVALSRGGEQQLCGHLPQQQRGTSNVPSTAAPFGRGAHGHVAPQTRRAFAAAPPPLGGIRDNRRPQSDTPSANLQQPEPRAGRWEEQLQRNFALGPMPVAPVFEIECTFTFSPSYTTRAVGHDVNQQPAAGRPTSQNPLPGNPTATTLPRRQPVSGCSKTPGNSRNQNGGNSNNQQWTAVQANDGLLSTGIGSRALEASNSLPAAQQRRGGGSQEDDQRASAPDASCRKYAHSAI